MKIVLWRGNHSPSLLTLIAECQAHENLLIICPPVLPDFEFMDFLPSGAVELCGDWPAFEAARIAPKINGRCARDDYPLAPHFGIFSSGTIGLTPRLILFRVEQVEASLNAILDLFSAVAIERIFCYPQPFHIFGFALGYLHAWSRGVEMLALNGPYSQTLHAQWLECPKPGLLTLGAPVHFRDLLGVPRTRDVETSASCIIGGAAVSPELWLRVQGELNIAEPSIGYGATEACPGISHLAPGRCPEQSGEIGWWLDGIEIESHTKDGFYFRGPSLCLAIVDTASVEKISFPKHVFIADMVEEMPGARLRFKGRADWRLNRGGEKYSLEGIERSIERATGVRMVAVPIPDIRLGEKLGILLQNSAGDLQVEASIREAVQKEFGWSLTEREIVTVAALPTTVNGKLDRRACVQVFASQIREA